MDKIYHTKSIQKKTVTARLISDKAGFQGRDIIRNKEGHDTMMNGSRRHNNP